MDRSSPPAGYRYYQNLFTDLQDKRDERRLFVRANFLALIPLGIVTCILWLPYQFYVSLSLPLAPVNRLSWPFALSIGATLLVVGISMPVHEALHGLALIAAGHRPLFAFHRGFFLATISPGSYLTRRQYLSTTMTPLVVMTLAGGLALLWLPLEPGRAILVALMLNAAASTGDLMVAWRVRRYPNCALFNDHKGIQVFLPLRWNAQEAAARRQESTG